MSEDGVARGGGVVAVLAVALCAFTAAEANYPQLSPQSQLAIFAGLGLVICFLIRPIHRRLRDVLAARILDVTLALASAACCAWVVVQTEPAFRAFWVGGQSLGNRAGQEAPLDVVVGITGLLLVLEATRRSIGVALPVLATVFLVYAVVGPSLPDWLFPHRGYGVERIVSQTFLHSQGVFGVALRVMFAYVFLFVVFGALLESTGATRFIIDFARRLLGGTPGGPAKVAVLSSGLMGSLSGSAVANTATTGTFTIPLMRSVGFSREMAGGVEAAASSGGALVPPVMGAGAYMMLEIIDPPVTYLQIIRAAILPALLYYLSLFLIVHFSARRIGAGAEASRDRPSGPLFTWPGAVFLSGLATLIGLLLVGYTVFRSVTVAAVVVLVVAAVRPESRLGGRAILAALSRAGREVVPLVSAAACVGIVIGVVTLTGVGTRLPTTILGLSQGSLLPALVLIMVSTIVLGMGLPSAVCYLLMATLIGPVLGELGVVPLAAHLFIFYFGMMSMVTPPVALAAYAAASIAGGSIMKTGFAAFRFALVGFTLPYMFVIQPELLMLAPDGSTASIGPIVLAFGVALFGIVPLAAAIAGRLFGDLRAVERAALLAAALLLLAPTSGIDIGGARVPVFNLTGAATVLAIAWLDRRRARVAGA